jgi:beta-lactam-binding protein with PASTA domain
MKENTQTTEYTSFPIQTTQPKVEVKLPAGIHRVSLVVVDSAGVRSLPDEITVQVRHKEEVVTVPNFIGLTEQQATSDIGNNKLILGGIEYREMQDGQAGEVLEQLPVAKRSVKAGSTVVLTVRRVVVKPIGVNVPNLIGRNQNEARNMILSAGLTLGRVQEKGEEFGVAGEVLLQEPAADTKVPKGASIFLVVRQVKKSMILVPNLVGMDSRKAGIIVAELGLNLGPVKTEFVDVLGERGDGEVIAQFPVAGENVKRGETVVLTIIRVQAVQPPGAQGNSMEPGTQLSPNGFITSSNGRYKFIYQGDGNLVLYAGDRALWASGTNGQPVGYCVMQGDGNLVIYTPDNRPIWASNTSPNPGSRLVVQDDGNAVIYRPDGVPVWATNTMQQPTETTVSIYLGANNGQYVAAEGGGGREAVANRDIPREWETFQLIAINGLPLRSGNQVALRAHNGQLIAAEGGGGQEVVANRDAIGPWETFTILHADGLDGEITDGQNVAFRAHNGQFVAAEGGGGREVVANRDAIGPWETFTIRVWATNTMQERTEIPNVVGLHLKEAEANIVRSGLVLGERKVSLVRDRRVDGVLIDQTPKAGSQVENGAIVSVTVGQVHPFFLGSGMRDIADLGLGGKVLTHPRLAGIPLEKIRALSAKEVSEAAGISEEASVSAIKEAGILSTLKGAGLDLPTLAASSPKEVANTAGIPVKEAKGLVERAAVLDRVNRAGFDKESLAKTDTEALASRSGISKPDAEKVMRMPLMMTALFNRQ